MTGEISTMTSIIICIIHRLIKSRILRSTGYVARMEEDRSVFRMSGKKNKNVGELLKF
jgi:hypothetical protein